MYSRQFLFAAVKQHTVVDQLQQPVFAAHLEQVLVQFVARAVCFIFLPAQKIFLFGANRAVLQTFRIIAGKDKLHSAEEPRIEFDALVGDALADSGAHGYAAALQLHYADCKSV